MIRKLQLKFIIIATAAVLVVLTVLLSLVNSFTYQNSLNKVYDNARFILSNEGVLTADAVNESNNDEDKPDFDAEDRYRIRYFTVYIDSNETVTKTYLKRIAAVDENDMMTVVSKTDTRSGAKGHFTYHGSEYAYVVGENAQGRVIVYIDCTKEIASADDFRRFSFEFGVICLIFFITFVSFYSKRAISPIIDNMESQRQFITNASHELKTPLAVISANTEVIEMTNGETEWTRSIIKQVEKLNKLIANLIKLSKLGEADKKAFYSVDVSAAARQSAEDFAPVFANSDKLFEADIADGVKVNATSDGISEIINILLDNAAKYCDDKGEVKLNAGFRTSNKGARIVVSNTYSSDNKVDTSKFFERFYREDESHNSKNTGHGIGLAMAQGLAEEYGGKITVSHKNSVITFTVTLP